MNETITVSSWHIVIDLRDNVAGTLGGGQRSIYTHAKTAETMRIRRRDLDQGDSNRHLASLKQLLNFAQINGRVVGTALVNGLAHVGTNENCIMAKMACHLWRNIRRRPHRHHVDDLYIV